jgi:ABC-2 type transport system ATP-binding protein
MVATTQIHGTTRLAQPAIEAEGVSKSFGRVQALRGMSFLAAPGTVLGLVGPNGSGKTTTVRILATLLQPDAGRLSVLGHDVTAEPAAVRQLIGLTGQYAAVDGFLTGRENLVQVGRLRHLTPSDREHEADRLLEELDLGGVAARLARTYSGGLRRRLDLAASLVGRPPVIFLDEPTTGLDPRSRLALWATVERVVADGANVLLTTQYMEEADRLADTVLVIDQGRPVASGTPAELKARIGGDHLELRIPAADQRRAACRLLVDWPGGPPQLDDFEALVRLALPAAGGVPLGLLAPLTSHGIEVVDLAVHRPTLDDVFLALTGRPGAAGRQAGSPQEKTR